MQNKGLTFHRRNSFTDYHCSLINRTNCYGYIRFRQKLRLEFLLFKSPACCLVNKNSIQHQHHDLLIKISILKYQNESIQI